MKTLSSLSPCPGGVSWGSGGLPRAGDVPLTAGGLARGRGCSRDDVEQGTHSCPGTRRPGVAVAALWFPAATEGRAEVTWGRGAGAEQRMFQVQPRGIGIGGTACP